MAVRRPPARAPPSSEQAHRGLEQGGVAQDRPIGAGHRVGLDQRGHELVERRPVLHEPDLQPVGQRWRLASRGARYISGGWPMSEKP